MSDRFDEVGYGGRPVGVGERPAVVTVDFQLGFTHPVYPSGRSPHIHRGTNGNRTTECSRTVNIDPGE